MQLSASQKYKLLRSVRLRLALSNKALARRFGVTETTVKAAVQYARLKGIL